VPVTLRRASVLVTGASGGLGAAIARRLHHEGSDLTITGRRETDLSALAAELGGRTRVVVADLALVADVHRLAESTADLDVLVANAGLPANGRLVELSADEIERSVDVNVRSTLLLTRLVLPTMLARGSGHIVIVGSLAGLACTPGSSVYHASKFALRGFGHALHAELRGSGIGVSLVSPTFVSGAGMWADTGAHAAHAEVTPEQVADACVEAIAANRAEILVAPATQRLAARAAVVFPQLLQPVLRSSIVPPEAVAAQKPKMTSR
jgi:short-subunit dehydrogenase